MTQVVWPRTAFTDQLFYLIQSASVVPLLWQAGLWGEQFSATISRIFKSAMLKKHFKNQNVAQWLSTHVRYSPAKLTPDRKARDATSGQTRLTYLQRRIHPSTEVPPIWEGFRVITTSQHCSRQGETQDQLPCEYLHQEQRPTETLHELAQMLTWKTAEVPFQTPSKTHAMKHAIYSACFWRVMSRNNSKTLTCYLSDLCFRVDVETTRTLSH